ncbi:MAG TPA: multiheme c-type cytochrome [Terriglobia bacterium]|nr:multiheme c-type cytochrome [Terriglobia bacterium]
MSATAGLVVMALASWFMSAKLPLAGFQSASKPGWNPVDGPPAGSTYTGPRVCAGCHASEAKTYESTPMAQAAAPASDAEILRSHPRLTFREGRYRYRIVRQGNHSLYSASDGRQTITEPILWVLGKGEAGQTYVFRHDGAYYQSRVSFFNDTQRLGVTLGDSVQVPATLEDALGDRLVENDARQCIACHTTGAVVGREFHPESAVPGVGCEACHGPGAQHVAAIQSGNSAHRAIFNPGWLAPYDLDSFCGSCHRTWTEVQLMHILDVRNVRFQPYRLEKSRCWSATDSRISCLACHDPHRTLVRSPSFYDAKCQACHQPKGAVADARYPGAPCPVGTRRCVTCHMPKYELPGGHFKFTDHYIRVVDARALYPS